MSFRKTGIIQMYSCYEKTHQTVHIVENYNKVYKVLDSQDGKIIRSNKEVSVFFYCCMNVKQSFIGIFTEFGDISDDLT